MKRKLFFVIISCAVFHISSFAFGADTNYSHLVSSDVLKQADFEMVWDFKLPIEKNEKISKMYLKGNKIYVLTNNNYLFSLNCEDGNVGISRPIGTKGFPIQGFERYDNIIVSIIGDKITTIDAEFGTENSSVKSEISPVCLPTKNDSFYYIAGNDNRLRAFRNSDKVKMFEAAAGNGSVITSVTADNNSVVFATDKGNLICIAPDKPKKIWEFNAAAGIIGPIVRKGDWLFFSCKDTNVYKVSLKTGSFEWKTQVKCIPKIEPRVINDIIYQPCPDGSLTAIEANTGKKLWTISDGLDILAQDANKSYVFTKTKKLAVLETDTGKVIKEVDFGNATHFIANTTDSKIYIADDAGLVTCIKPIQYK